MESKTRKLWILIRNEAFLGYIQENLAVAREVQKSGFKPIFISQLTELKLDAEDKALIFQPETEEALQETTTPELWREFMFNDAMFNDNIYPVRESEIYKRILDESIFTRICGAIQELGSDRSAQQTQSLRRKHNQT